MRSIVAIVIHHSVSSTCTDREEITRWHKHRGFRTIGYHYLVRLDHGQAIIERGRAEDERGAHLVPQYGAEISNSNSLGICIAGNHEINDPDGRLWTQALELAAELCHHHLLTEDQVYGHNELRSTLCPGTKMDMELFRGELHDLLDAPMDLRERGTTTSPLARP